MNTGSTPLTVSSARQHDSLVDALLGATIDSTEPGRDRRIDTHISTVLLLGPYAYKIKKPIKLSFLDFSTLEKRRIACTEEIRLNSRLTADLYQGVIPISGTPDQPVLNGRDTPIEWAIRMRRFSVPTVLSETPEVLDNDLVDQLAQLLADFHRKAASSPPDSPFGSPATILKNMLANYDEVRTRHAGDPTLLASLQRWSRENTDKLRALILSRQHSGHVRECHGDLHLGNIIVEDGQPLIFDGIEFNESLRWIDCINDLAFLTMDLTHIGRANLARRLLNRYLEINGDYQALALLRLYEVYRAMVRAKVEAITLDDQQLPSADRNRHTRRLSEYLHIADTRHREHMRGLIITFGVTGSGKSQLTQQIIEMLPAIRIRSDVERKRLAIKDTTVSTGGKSAGLYSKPMDDKTYRHLLEMAKDIIQAGYIAVVDATFLQLHRRQPFTELAQQMAVPLVILQLEIPRNELLRRIKQRRQEGQDPSDGDETVLQAQLACRKPLSNDEQELVIQITPTNPLDMDALKQCLNISG